jgi:hypothetical protein
MGLVPDLDGPRLNGRFRRFERTTGQLFLLLKETIPTGRLPGESTGTGLLMSLMMMMGMVMGMVVMGMVRWRMSMSMMFLAMHRKRRR